MQPRPLGSTGIMVSPLGLGTVKLGRNRQVKYPTPFDLPSDDEALTLLNTAHECGINLIDTAPAYGTSEERLGKLLPRTPGGRDAWVIVTKAGEEFDPHANSGRGDSRFDFCPESIRRSVERSLKRLATDRLDAVLIHSDGNDLGIINTLGSLDALEDLKREGRVRAVGISTKTPEGGVEAAKRCDVVMLTLNPEYSGDLPAIEEASRRGAGVLIKKALASGHAALAQSEDPVRESFRHVLTAAGPDAISSIIVGTINPHHLRHNARIIASLAKTL